MSKYKHVWKQRKIESLNKEIEDTQKKWMEILELKHSITEIKIQWMNETVEWRGEKKESEHEDRTELTQFEQKENRLKKIEQNIRNLWYYNKRCNIHIIAVLE